MTVTELIERYTENPMIDQYKFNMDDRVVLVNCCELSGATGTVLGVASDLADAAFYIVGLDQALPDRRAVVMIASCMRPVEVE